MPVKPLPLAPAEGNAGAHPFPLPLARNSGDDSPPVICRAVFEEICLLANGDIVCSSCDTSGQRVYGNAFTDRIADVFDGSRYQEMRNWLLQSRPGSWCPAIKFHCPRRSSAPGDDDHRTGNRVKLLKIEPVTYCNIKCPACPVVTDFVDDPVVRERRGHKILPIEVMLDVIDQLPDLETLLYYNFGEPFLHKDTVPFLREVRRRRPKLYIATNTNGLVLTPAQIEALGTEALMDYLVFSIDGAYPESYKKYRVGGDLFKALGKMEALVKTVRAAGNLDRVRVVWQYIFFEWNDSDAELARAKELAAQIGVPIDWIIPTGYGASKRFTHGSAAFAQLTGGEDSTPHQSAPAKLTSRLRQNGFDELDVFQKCDVSCELRDARPLQDDAPQPSAGPSLAPPPTLPAPKRPGKWGRQFIRFLARRMLPEPVHKVVNRLVPGPIRRALVADSLTGAELGGVEARFLARLSTDDGAAITLPKGSAVLFEVDVENRLRPTAEAYKTERFRLGFRLLTAEGVFIRELDGCFIPPEAAQPDGQATASLRMFVEEEPGQYQLLLDIVDEVDSYWFSERGSSPLMYRLRIE